MPITVVQNTDAVTMGLGTLGLSALPLTSPAVYTDVGFIKAMTAEYSRELKDFESAGVLVKRLAFRDRLTFKSEWAEMSISNLSKVFPCTKSGGSPPNETIISFGGDRTITRYAVRFEHFRDDGKVVTLDMHRATPSGTFALAFAEEEYIKYPVEFGAEIDTTKPTGQKYGKITIA